MELVKTMDIEILGTVSVYLGIGIQVAFSLLLGGLVGYDREKKLKSAGIKTNILICLGATLYTSVGVLMSASSIAAGGVADPARMAAQIVSGIGFLGAGAIIQGRGGVIGLTTAATIWVVAALGFTIGTGYPFTAFGLTIVVLLVLKLISPLYSLFEGKRALEHFELEVSSRGTTKKNVLSFLKAEGITVDEVKEEEWDYGRNGRQLLTCCFTTHYKKIDRAVYNIESLIKVEDVAYHTLMDSEH